MQIIIHNPGDDSLSAFLVVIQKMKDSKKRILGYEISPESIQIGQFSEEDIPKIEIRKKKIPVQILLKHAELTWENLADIQAMYIHGIITKKDPYVDRKNIQLGKFSFEFGGHNQKRPKIVEDLCNFVQKDLVTRVYHARYLKGLLTWDINRYRRASYKTETIATLPSLSLLQISIHRLKERRSRDGDLVSDHLLLEVANRLNDRVRSTDILARWEDGFMIYLPDTQENEACVLSEVIQKCLEENPILMSEGKEITLAVSTGVATYKPDMDTDTLIKEVGMRLLQAKQRHPYVPDKA